MGLSWWLGLNWNSIFLNLIFIIGGIIISKLIYNIIRIKNNKINKNKKTILLLK